MTNSSVILPAFLQKIAEAMSMLPAMVLEERLAAIEFLNIAVSSSKADFQSASKTSNFEGEDAASCQTSESRGGGLSKLETTPLRNASDIYGSDSSSSSSEISHYMKEQPDTSVDAGTIHSMEHVNLEAQESKPIRQCSRATEMSADSVKWLPKEYNMVFVNDEDFFEDDDAEEKRGNIVDMTEKRTGQTMMAGFANGPSNPKVYSCFVCQKHFSSLVVLENHKLSHSKPYACNFCDARYFRQGTLKDHERKHTGEKPFACPQCGDLMRTKRMVTLHVQKQCSTVQKSDNDNESGAPILLKRLKISPQLFKTKSVPEMPIMDEAPVCPLAVDLRQSREYVCDECNTSFYAKESFYRHILCHKPRKYDCDRCPAKFFLKSSLDAHVQAHARKQKLPVNCALQQSTKLLT